jgi:hypothetical protein
MVSDVQADERPGAPGKVDALPAGSLTLRLDEPTLRELEAEAAKLGMSLSALARFAVLYYLADRDGGRIARRLHKPSSPEESHPLGKLLGS